jgi:hypothetical protein
MRGVDWQWDDQNLKKNIKITNRILNLKKEVFYIMWK